jgi:formamidopyrimidine-DNA glycosylase
MSEEECKALLAASKEVMSEWIARLREEVGDGFPDKVTAFHPAMAVHGKFKQPCPRCGKPIQRIVYAENEANYCAVCQTAGKLLSDRSLARLLKDNWPKTIEELESRKRDKS